MKPIRCSLKTVLAVPIVAGLLFLWMRWTIDGCTGVTSHPERGGQTCEFVVVDGHSRAPIQGATVQVQGPYGEYVCPSTAGTGNTETDVEVSYTLIFHPLVDTPIRRMWRADVQVKVSADGYRETVARFRPESGPEGSRHKTVISLARIGEPEVAN